MQKYVNGELVDMTVDEVAAFEAEQTAAVPADDQVPASITPLQARKGLRAWGIGKTEIAAFFMTISDRTARDIAEDAWEYASEIDRDDPLIAGCADFFCKSPADVDQFFRDAAKL